MSFFFFSDIRSVVYESALSLQQFRWSHARLLSGAGLNYKQPLTCCAPFWLLICICLRWHYGGSCAPMVFMRPGCLLVPCTSSETVPATFKSGFSFPPPHAARRGAESSWVDLDIPCFVLILFRDCTYFRGHQPHVSPLCAIWFTGCIFSLWYSQRRYSCQITCEDDSCVLSLPLMSCRSACISWLPRPLPFMTILYSIICKDLQHAPISDLIPSISIINIYIFSLKQMDLYLGLPTATT